jgi:hypothetical protein
MNEIALSGRSSTELQAWRFTFEQSKIATSSGIVIRDPEQPAVAHPIALETALAEVEGKDDALYVIWVPIDRTVPLDMERRLCAWIEDAGQRGPTIRVSIRTVRVVWANARALVYAGLDHWPDALDAVIRFTALFQDTLALEQRLRSIWPTINRHVPLSHTVSYREQRQRRAVGQMTETVTRMRMSFLQIQSAVEQLDARLSSGSKRLCAELILQGAIHDRLAELEDPIGFMLNHYELANTRLIDHAYASTELLLTTLIVIALVLQTAIILVQELL